jgi:hypothetical protein
MKRLLFLFLCTVIAVLYFGCSDNPSTPEGNQGNHVTTSLSKVDRFTGTSIFIEILDQGVTTDLPGGGTLTIGRKALWQDVTTDPGDPRVEGFATWTVNQKVNKTGNGHVWGTAEMVVDADLGKWAMTWHGVVSGNPANGDLYIKGIAIGEGIEGSVEGLNAKWTYILDQANVGFFYTSEGFIKE